MTQVDMPQLSMRRYVDLVKRRRWQVVPFSLFGLLVGGLIAFFIPRLYVAETTLIHNQLPGGPTDKEKPFRAIVDSAKSAIPIYVKDAITELGWPEVKGLKEYDQEQFYRGCEARVLVSERSGGDDKRSYVQLRVAYKDRDGPRSAELVNTLVRVWMEKRTEELRAPALEERQAAKDTADAADQVLSRCRKELAQLQQNYGISPKYDLRDQREDFSDEREDRLERAQEQEGRRLERSRLAAKIEQDQTQLAQLPAKVAPEVGFILTEAAKHKETKALADRALYAFLAYTGTHVPGTPASLKAKRNYDNLIATIQRMLPKVPVDPDGMVENPDHRKKREEIEADLKQLAELDAAILAADERLEKEKASLIRLAVGFELCADKQQALTEAADARALAVGELRKATEKVTALQKKPPVHQLRPAAIPPTPTEPNIMIVALGGSVLGLFAAIAIILLFDMLQGSYKTLEDVERGLGVPVLGGVSHLETEGERVAAVRSRRRATLVAAAAVVLVSLVVAVFYVDPTRLPPAVRNILTLILGA